MNDCQPSCALGKFRSYPVNVKLDRPERWNKHPEQQRYTRVHLVYTDGTPPDTQRSVTYPLY
ncbi:hypothetical protein ACFVT5_37775 [Streptomyces sp. NPDC058001]|uniref:hypothetical protein n=1 Tax=Streptomyces sp. NPDC058001 TaxID=3346300 RepID=UPI0036E2464A